jgi:hypothetical protein
VSVAWYIDALDARAGHAFASCRGPDLGRDEIDLDGAAVFVGPPSFRPEALVGRSTGFAAASRSAQLGLFANRAEIGFPSLESLVEFVRRAYVSSGGGDGGEGIGPAAPPGPPRGGEGPDRGEGEGGEGGEPGTAALALLSSGAQCAEIARSLSLQTIETAGKGPGAGRASYARVQLTPAPSSISSMGSANGVIDAQADLAAGAALLLEELVLRAPPRGGFDASWQVALNSLRLAVHKFRLLPMLVHEPLGHSLRRQLKLAYRRNPDIFLDVRVADEAEYLLPRLLALLPPDSHYPWWYWLEDAVDGAELPIETGLGREGGDPFDELSTWPVPEAIASYVKLSKEDDNARGLLCAVVADPALLSAKSKLGFQISLILLFSAVHLTARHLNLPFTRRATSAAALAVIIADALAWLDLQMPRHAFAQEVEQAIGQARHLHYSTSQPGSRSA